MVNCNKSLLGGTGCLGIFYFCLLVPFTEQHLCDLQETIPCHWSASASHLPLLLPREAEDFSWVGNCSNHVPLPTYLDWLQPIFNSSRLIFNHVKNILLEVKSLIKSDSLDMENIV